MTPLQRRKYFFEWGRVREYLLRRGGSAATIAEERHKLHIKALGRDKSSNDFSNLDLDKVLGAFKAVYDGGNLNAQIAQLDQEEGRRARLLERCKAATESMFYWGDSRLSHDNHRDGYVRGTARKVLGKELETLTAAELGKLVGTLEARVKRLRDKAQAKPEVPAGENPF